MWLVKVGENCVHVIPNRHFGHVVAKIVGHVIKTVKSDLSRQDSESVESAFGVVIELSSLFVVAFCELSDVIAISVVDEKYVVQVGEELLTVVGVVAFVVVSDMPSLTTLTWPGCSLAAAQEAQQIRW